MDLECMSFIGAAKHEKKMLAYHGICFLLLGLFFSFLQPGAVCLIVSLILLLYIPVNSYGHVGAASILWDFFSKFGCHGIQNVL